MFESISRGWSLTKASFRVLKLDKEILLLPMMSGLAMILVALSFFVPLATIGAFTGTDSPLMWVALFGFYFVSYFIVIFFNAAVVECAMIRFNGGDPIVRDGLRKASQKIGKIAQWALVAATVGLILRALESAARNVDNPIGRIAAQIAVGLAGAAWNLATFFVVPVLIYKNQGPFASLKDSVSTLRRVFGEGVTGMITTGIIFFLFGLLGLIPMFIGIMLLSGGSLVIGGIFIAIAVAYWILVWSANTAVDGILTAALYKYSLDGEMPGEFKGTQPVVYGAQAQ